MSDYLYDWFGRGIITKLPVRGISSKHISFTFGDSMAQMDRVGRKEPFLKECLFEFISQHGNDVEQFVDSIKNPYTYIEAQLWDDDYCIL